MENYEIFRDLVVKNWENIEVIPDPENSLWYHAISGCDSPKRLLNTLPKDENIQIAFVDKFPQYFQYIENPSERVKNAACFGSGWNLRYIKDPTPKQIIYALKNTGWAIQFIKDPTVFQQCVATSEDECALYFIESPCDEVLEYVARLKMFIGTPHRVSEAQCRYIRGLVNAKRKK